MHKKDIEMITVDLRAHLRNIARDMIRTYLVATNGNKTAAAKLLKMGRTTLIAKIKSLKMNEWLEDKNSSRN